MQKKLSDIIFTVVFFTIILAVSISFLVMPKAEMSEIENRTLAKLPSFSWASFTDNSFNSSLEQYINDHMIFKDQFILTKNTADILMLDSENNDAIIGEDGFIFARNQKNTSNIPKSINAVNYFAEQGFNIYMGIIPSSAEIYKDKLPAFNDLVDESKEIKSIYDSLNVKTIDIVSALKNSNNENLYFKTDHHLTTDGIDVLYDTIGSELGWEEIPEKDTYKKSVNGFRGAYYRKFPNFLTDPEPFVYYDIDGYELNIGNNTYNSLVDNSKLDTFDKYASMLHGNNALSVVKNPNADNGKKILVLKDSYFNMLAPLAAYNYQEMHIVDLRFFMGDCISYMKENNISDVLILYSLAQMQENGGLALLDDFEDTSLTQ